MGRYRAAPGSKVLNRSQLHVCMDSCSTFKGSCSAPPLRRPPPTSSVPLAIQRRASAGERGGHLNRCGPCRVWEKMSRKPNASNDDDDFEEEELGRDSNTEEEEVDAG